jgi:hypothetical protein
MELEMRAISRRCGCKALSAARFPLEYGLIIPQERRAPVVSYRRASCFADHVVERPQLQVAKPSGLNPQTLGQRNGQRVTSA